MLLLFYFQKAKNIYDQNLRQKKTLKIDFFLIAVYFVFETNYLNFNYWIFIKYIMINFILKAMILK